MENGPSSSGKDSHNKVNHILVEHPLILYTNHYSITETSIPPIGPFKPLVITLQCLTPNCHGTALCSILLSVWAISIFIVVASILRKGIERREARFTRTWQANDGNQSPTLCETPAQAARHSTFMCGTGNCGRTKTHRDHLSQTIFGLRVLFTFTCHTFQLGVMGSQMINYGPLSLSDGHTTHGPMGFLMQALVKPFMGAWPFATRNCFLVYAVSPN